MRFQLFLIGWCIVAAGCNADPRCRRETALLRAEILDLEDKYYLTKAQRDDALAVLDSSGRSAESQKIARAMPDSTEVIYGDVIYEGDGIYEGGVIVEDGVVYDGGAYYASPNGPTLSAYPSGEVFYEDSLADLPADLPADLQVEGQVTGTPSVFPADESMRLDIGIGDLSEPERAEELQVSPPNNPNPIVPSGSRAPTPATQEFPEVESDPSDPLSLLLSDPSGAVAEIVINPNQTRGQDTDQQPGDDELEVLLQLKTDAGETLLQPGQLTVSVIDPTVASSSQRVGMWKFVAEESKLFFANEDTELAGIQLHLPWGETRPQGGHVVVFVRYLSRDGRRFETSAKVPVRSASTPAVEGEQSKEQVAGWNDRRGSSSSSANRSNERTIQAVPVGSSGTARVSKPNWRPVR